MYKHMLLPTDGSEIATRGLQQGIELAARLGAKVTIVTVTEPLTVYPSAEGVAWSAAPALADYDEQQARSAQALLDESKRHAEAASVPAETLYVPRAQPASAIVETAKSQGCDLIVMSSHGRRGFRRLLLGSQTAEVLARSSVAVLVVPPSPPSA